MLEQSVEKRGKINRLSLLVATVRMTRKMRQMITVPRIMTSLSMTSYYDVSWALGYPGIYSVISGYSLDTFMAVILVGEVT